MYSALSKISFPPTLYSSKYNWFNGQNQQVFFHVSWFFELICCGLTSWNVPMIFYKELIIYLANYITTKFTVLQTNIKVKIMTIIYFREVCRMLHHLMNSLQLPLEDSTRLHPTPFILRQQQPCTRHFPPTLGLVIRFRRLCRSLLRVRRYRS